MGLTALGLEDLGDGAEVEGIGDEGIEGVGGDGNDLSAAHGDGGPFQHFGLRVFEVDLDQDGGHKGKLLAISYELLEQVTAGRWLPLHPRPSGSGRRGR